jgi:hypothetical protein
MGSISVRNEGLNSLVEQLHGTRDRKKKWDKCKRKNQLRKLSGLWEYINTIREHTTLGKTHVEQAEIKVDLEKGNKVENLIKLGVTKNAI